MGDLGSLNVNITASAHQANTAIDELIKHLTKLNGALNNFRADSSYMKGLNNLVTGLRELRINLNGLDPKKTQDMAKAMESLAKAGENLAKINGVGSFTSSVEKDGNKLFAFSDKAKKEADEIAKKFKFDDKNGVNELAQAIEKLYASVGDDDEVRRSMQDIDALIETYARYENELHQVAAAQNEAIRSTHGKLNSDWQEALGGDYESARRNRAIVGIRNTSKSGANAGTIIGENTNLTGIQESANESENLAMALEILERNAYDAEHALVGFHEVSELVSGGMEAIRSVADGLVTSLGLDAEKFREVSAAAASVDNSVDDFMDIDIPDEEFTTFGQAAANAAPSVQQVGQAATSAAQPVEQMANAEQKAAAAGAEIQQVGNPFAGIVEGMRSLNDIHPSDSLRNLEYIRTTVSKIGGDMGAAAGASLSQIANGLKAFEGVNIPDYGDKMPTLAKGLRSLGSGNVVNAAQSLAPIAQGLRLLNDVKITADVEKIAQLAYAVSRFGLANIQKAAANIPPLATALNGLITTLSNAPAVSENTIRMVEALSNLNVHSTNGATGMNRLSTGLKRYTGNAKKAHSATKGLASAIGKIYATYWLLFRAIGKIGKAINLASDLKEIQNVVDVTFGDMNDKMNEFAKNAVDTLGMSELTAKQIGSKFQAMGSNMGISKEMVKSTNDFVQKATQGYADVADSMADISLNLTRLAGDMASFYNQDYADVAEKLQAVFTGQTRPLRAYGLDLTQATLKEWALKNGLDADIKSMTQAEKTLLRYQYVLANTTAAQGDFIRTQDTWANTIKIAKERLKQLGVVLGQIAIYTFKPLVQSFNKAMKRIIELATATLNSLGKIFGWQIEWTDGGVLRDEEEAAGDIADDMGEAADNAKKFKNFLLGIDELNLLPSDDDKDKGGKGAGGIGAGLGDLEGGLKIKPIEKGFESLYDTLYKLGKRIAEVQKEWLKGIDWDKINKKMRSFGKGFAQFLNGYLSDIELFYHKGRFLAKAINAVAHAIDAFFKEFDGYQFGSDIGMEINGFTRNLDWGVIKSASYEMAHDITGFINGAFAGINWYDVGRTLAEGINTAVLFVSTLWNETDWKKIGTALGDAVNSLFENLDVEELARMFKGKIQAILDLANNFLEKADFVMIGEQIGKFLKELDLSGFTDDIARLLWNLIKAGFESLGTAFNEAPLDAALVTAFAGAKFIGFGNLLGTNMSKAASNAFLPKITSFLTTDLGSLASSGSIAGKAMALGSAIGASIVAGYVGFNVGEKLGEALFPEDSMWYGMSLNEVLTEIAENAGYVPDAIGEMVAESKDYFNDMDFAYLSIGDRIRDQAAEILLDMDGEFAEYSGREKEVLKESQITWGQIKDNLRLGKTEIDDSGFEKLKEIFRTSGVSAADYNSIISSLKEAQEEYYNGFSKFYEEEGKLYKTREEAYAAYKEYDRAIRESSLKGAIDKTKEMSSAVVNHAKSLDGSKKSWDSFDKAATSASDDLLKIEYAMSDVNSISSVARSGIVDLGDAFSKMSDSGKGIEQASTGMKSMNEGVRQFSSQLPSTQSNFKMLSTSMQTDVLGIDVAFKKMYTDTMVNGNKTIAWFKGSFIPLFSTAYWQNILSGIPIAFQNAFTMAFNNVKQMWGQFTQWANENMKLDVTAQKKGNNGAEVKMQFPAYEKGGFPEDGMFFANHTEMVGQFANGRTAVANNEQITDGIERAVYRAMSDVMSNAGGQSVNVELRGDAADFFTAMVNENNKAIMRTGASPIRV